MKSFIALTLLVCVNASYVFEDNFNTFDRSKWYVEVTGSPNNNEYEYYRDSPENLYAEDGHLVIKPLKENYEGHDYTSARIHSYFNWKYGRVEVRAKLPNGEGLWPAIWMMPEYSVYGGWPYSGEIDIVEARGQDLWNIQSTTHYGASYGHASTTSGDMSTACEIDTYHIYTLDWTPDEVVYRFDNTAFFRQDISGYLSSYYSQPTQPFDQNFFMILNVAIGGDYLDGPYPYTVWNYPDAEMHIDYMRVSPLEDIATQQCVVKSSASTYDVCNSVNWACNMQSYADVSTDCTWELQQCCEDQNSCSQDTIDSLASAVFTDYDNQLNDDDSCDFGGTAERKYVLNDPEPAAEQCLIKSSANDEQICDGMIWACGSEDTYADVSSTCYSEQGQMALDCCYANPYSCDDAQLRAAADLVFQSYYDQNPAPSSCDFGGVCYLDGIEPIACVDTNEA